MKKGLKIIGIILGVFSICLSGCVNPLSDESKFIGTWESIRIDATMVFDADGTGYVNGSGSFGSSRMTTYFNWEISKGKLIMSAYGQKSKNSYEFKENNTMLTITAQDGAVETLRKIS